MRKLTIQDLDNKKQQSMIDDPFSLEGAFAGFAKMSKTITIHDHAQALVSAFAKYQNDYYTLTLDMLTEDEQLELARHYIEFTGRELTECVNGSDFSLDNDYTCALLAMLKDNNEESRTHFAEVVQRNIIIYYTDSLNKLLSDACDSYLRDCLNEQGYHARQDLEHGDIVWSRF